MTRNLIRILPPDIGDAIQTPKNSMNLLIIPLKKSMILTIFTLFENYQKKSHLCEFTESLGVQEWWTNRTFFRPQQLHGKRRGGLCSSERKKHFKWVYKGRKALEKLRRDFSEAIQTPKATWKSNSLYYSCLLCWESRWLQLQILKKVNASEASILL